MINIDKVYIIHHKPLTERKMLLDKYLIENNIEAEWVEYFLPDEIKENYKEIVGDFVIDPNARLVCQGQYTYYPNAGVKVTIPELSLYLKHKHCIEEQLKNNYQNILILEDDVILFDDFNGFLDKCMSEFNNTNVDMMFIGSDFNFHAPNIQPDKYVYVNENQLTRCAHGYVVNIKCSEKILDHMYPVNLPWDFKLNEIIVLEKLKIAWSEPCIYQNKNFPTALIK